MEITPLSDDPEGLITALFGREVPEIASGVVTLRALARIPGVRTKVAVASSDPAVSPIDACVGPEGSRVLRIVDALHGERVDVVLWSPMADRMIRNALAPRTVVSVTLDAAAGRAVAMLSSDPFPFNYPRDVHGELASRLSGWNVTIVDPLAR